MTDFYHAGSRALQDRFDTRRLADRIEARLVTDCIGPDDKAFIEARDMFFLATVDARGQPSCSYKGGDPGFVRVVDACTLAFPCYVPRAGCATPVPGWKRSDWAADVLPENDSARGP